MSKPFHKSEHNKCPICGMPRGKGKYEFAHGKCAEIRASTEGKKPAFEKQFGKSTGIITVEQHEKSIRNSHKKNYLSGKNLPKWMFD